MANRATLFSNNPDFRTFPPAKADLQFVDGSALDVLVAARDFAHKGWSLANHPLYGNFRPHQQPYRSLLMLPPGFGVPEAKDDPFTPLSALEEALCLYQSAVRKSHPEDLPGHMRQDCALIDRELLAATLESIA